MVDLVQGRLDLQDPPDPRSYDCATCPWTDRRDRLCDQPGDGRGAELLEEARRRHPHLTPSTSDPRSCRLLRVHPEVWRWVRQYRPWKRGVLLRSGGLEDQPARWAEAMDVIDCRLSHHEAHPLPAKDTSP